jgi:hypothetical protein
MLFSILHLKYYKKETHPVNKSFTEITVHGPSPRKQAKDFLGQEKVHRNDQNPAEDVELVDQKTTVVE